MDHNQAIEESLNAKETTELVVMIDTFKPLNMTKIQKKLKIKIIHILR